MTRQGRAANNFLKASKALKAAGESQLRKELHGSVRKAARPLIPRARAAARAQLPKRGGLAKAVASSPMRAQVLTGRNKYGVRIAVGKNRRAGARDTNRGRIRHPLFGNRERWYSQQTPKGWFDDTMRAAAPPIRREVEKAIQKSLDDIARRGRR